MTSAAARSDPNETAIRRESRAHRQDHGGRGRRRLPPKAAKATINASCSSAHLLPSNDVSKFQSLSVASTDPDPTSHHITSGDGNVCMGGGGGGG